MAVALAVLGLLTGNMVGLLVEAIKEQAGQIEAVREQQLVLVRVL